MFEKERLPDIIKNFICFSNEGLKKFKILAGYHQYFAVRKAIESTKNATVTDGKGGVFWHTQGERVIIVIPHESAVNTRASAA